MTEILRHICAALELYEKALDCDADAHSFIKYVAEARAHRRKALALLDMMEQAPPRVRVPKIG